MPPHLIKHVIKLAGTANQVFILFMLGTTQFIAGKEWNEAPE